MHWRLVTCLTLAIVSTAAAATQNPAHLAEFPAIARVKLEIRGTDEADTVRRQIAAFFQLRTILYDLALAQGRDRNEVTPDEKRMADAFYVEGATLQMNHKVTTTKYDVDPRFRDALFDLFFTPAFRANYFRLTKQMDDRVAARSAAEQAEFKQAQSGVAAGATTDPGTLEARRCIASGRSPLDCIGSVMSAGLGDLFGNVNPALKPAPVVPGLRVNGVFPGAAGLSLIFRADAVELKCAELEPASTPYSIARQGTGVVVTVATLPAPVAFTVQPNGSITGPPSAVIRGQVLSGMQQGTRTYSDGRTEPISRPVYSTRDVNCEIGTLSPTGPSPRKPLGDLANAPVFSKPAMDLAGSKPLIARPGLRLAGTFASASGLALEFHDESVILTCRQAFVAREYHLAVSGAVITITINHGGTPLALRLLPDGSISASGSVVVTGRDVAGVRDDGSVIYTSTNDTCAISTLNPRRPS